MTATVTSTRPRYQSWSATVSPPPTYRADGVARLHDARTGPRGGPSGVRHRGAHRGPCRPGGDLASTGHLGNASKSADAGETAGPPGAGLRLSVREFRCLCDGAGGTVGL